jgi:hypothetical protein
MIKMGELLYSHGYLGWIVEKSNDKIYAVEWFDPDSEHSIIAYEHADMIPSMRDNYERQKELWRTK